LSRCEHCRCDGADCLSRDGLRLCESCLYEKVSAERDAIEDEARILRSLLADARSELAKQIRVSRAVYDGDLRSRIDAVLGRYEGDDCVFCHTNAATCGC